jgi:hypothetical protein
MESSINHTLSLIKFYFTKKSTKLTLVSLYKNKKDLSKLGLKEWIVFGTSLMRIHCCGYNRARDGMGRGTELQEAYINGSQEYRMYL